MFCRRGKDLTKDMFGHLSKYSSNPNLPKQVTDYVNQKKSQLESQLSQAYYNSDDGKCTFQQIMPFASQTEMVIQQIKDDQDSLRHLQLDKSAKLLFASN
jgi:hypothetical protein